MQALIRYTIPVAHKHILGASVRTRGGAGRGAALGGAEEARGAVFLSPAFNTAKTGRGSRGGPEITIVCKAAAGNTTQHSTQHSMPGGGAGAGRVRSGVTAAGHGGGRQRGGLSNNEK